MKYNDYVLHMSYSAIALGFIFMLINPTNDNLVLFGTIIAIGGALILTTFLIEYIQHDQTEKESVRNPVLGEASSQEGSKEGKKE